MWNIANNTYTQYFNVFFSHFSFKYNTYLYYASYYNYLQKDFYFNTETIKNNKNLY